MEEATPHVSNECSDMSPVETNQHTVDRMRGHRIHTAPSSPACDEVAATSQQCDILTSAECVDKDTALQILKLYHSLEWMRQTTVVEKDKLVAQMRNELAMSKFAHTNASTLLQATHDIDTIKTFMREISDKLQTLGQRVHEIEGRIVAMPMKKR